MINLLFLSTRQIRVVAILPQPLYKAHKSRQHNLHCQLVQMYVLEILFLFQILQLAIMFIGITAILILINNGQFFQAQDGA